MKTQRMKLTTLLLCFSAAACMDAMAAGAADAALVKKGEYIALAGDCIACHTSPGSEPYAGGNHMPTLGVDVYASNITPDRETGIGSYSFVDFDRAVRHGINGKGKSLYPTMPYYTYAQVTEADMRAMYAFFMQGVKPVRKTVKDATERNSAERWRHANAPGVADFEPAPDQSPEIARGAYLVEVLGHCGYCHTSYGGNAKPVALTVADGSRHLAGGEPLETWLAKNLRGDYRTGLGNWDEADLFDFLRTGRNRYSAAFGIMASIVHLSLQNLDDADTMAVVRYLKALPAVDPNDKPQAYDARVARALYAGDDSQRGAALYIDNCAACHRTDGRGYATVFPALANNAVMNTDDPTALIHVVLTGSTLPAMKQAPSSLTMPPLGWRLDDQQVADVVTFIRSGWGNSGPAVSAGDVAKLRKTLLEEGGDMGKATITDSR